MGLKSCNKAQVFLQLGHQPVLWPMFVPVSAVRACRQAGQWIPTVIASLVKSALHSVVFVPQKGISSPLGLATFAGSSADLGADQDLGFIALLLLQCHVGSRSPCYLAGVSELGEVWG